MSEGTAPEITPERARSMRRLLYVVAGFAALLVLLAVPLLIGSYARYGAIVTVVACILAGLSVLTLRAIRSGHPATRRLAIYTGVVTVVLSVPLIPIWVGLLTVVTGIGLLVVTLAPEREPT